MVATSGSSVNPANPPARIPSVSLVSPTMANAIAGMVSNVTGKNYSMSAMMRQYLCISKFILGNKTEANALETPYLQAGFDFVLAVHERYMSSASSYQAALDVHARDASDKKYRDAFDELLKKWQPLFPHQVRSGLGKLLSMWEIIQMDNVNGNSYSQSEYDAILQQWEAVGGSAPTYEEIKHCALPWPPSMY